MIDWNAVEAISTTLAIVVGIYQLLRIKNQSKKEATLAICKEYNIDPTIDASARMLRKMSFGSVPYDKAEKRSSVTTILNYLDHLAIGIHQNVYIDSLARDHMDEILFEYCKSYLNVNSAEELGYDLRVYQDLEDLERKWRKYNHSYSEGYLR